MSGTSCPEHWLLEALVSGAATVEEQERWRPHLEDCSACSQFQDQMESLLVGSELRLPPPLARGRELEQEFETLPVEFWPWSSHEGEEVGGADEAKPLPVGEPQLEAPSAGGWRGLGMQVMAWSSVACALLLFLVGPWQSSTPSLAPRPVPKAAKAPKKLAAQAPAQKAPRNKPSKGTRPKGPKAVAAPVPEIKARFRFFYRRGSSPPKQGRDGLVAQAGDQLRFAFWYSDPDPSFLLLFVLDAKGQLTPLYPSKEQGTYELHPGKTSRRLLPGGVVLDTSSVDERIFVCLTRRPKKYAELRRRLQEIGVLRAMADGKWLASGCTVYVSWLLKRSR